MRAQALPWLVLSAALHVAGALALRTPPPAPRARPPRLDDLVELALHAPAAAPSAPSPPAQREAPRALGTDRARTPRTPPVAARAARPRAHAAPSAHPARAAESAPDGEPRGPDAAPARGSRPPSLSPDAVARAAIDGEPPPDADAGAAAPTAEARLNRAIMAGVASHVDTIPDPVLKPAPRGGYVYEGHGFDAIIGPDGSVALHDRYGTVVVPLVPFRTPDGRWHVPLGLGGTFRLFEWLDRKFGKNDPYRSERRWFLERTRPLREKLERDHYGRKAPGRALGR